MWQQLICSSLSLTCDCRRQALIKDTNKMRSQKKDTACFCSFYSVTEYAPCPTLFNTGRNRKILSLPSKNFYCCCYAQGGKTKIYFWFQDPQEMRNRNLGNLGGDERGASEGPPVHFPPARSWPSGNTFCLWEQCLALGCDASVIDEVLKMKWIC